MTVFVGAAMFLPGAKATAADRREAVMVIFIFFFFGLCLLCLLLGGL